MSHAGQNIRDAHKRNRDHRKLDVILKPNLADFCKFFADTRKRNRDHRNLNDNITADFSDFCKYFVGTRIHFSGFSQFKPEVIKSSVRFGTIIRLIFLPSTAGRRRLSLRKTQAERGERELREERGSLNTAGSPS